MHGVQPEPEQEAQQRCRSEPDGRHGVHPPLALEQRDDAGEDQAEHDREQTEHHGDRAPPLHQPRPHRTRQRPERDEDDREAEHEQHRPEQHPAAVLGRRPVGEVGAAETGGVGEVAGEQRDHAGREEGDQPGDDRHRDRQRQEPESACSWNQSPIDAPPARALVGDLLHQLHQRERGGQHADDRGGDASRRRRGRRRPAPCRGSACRGTPAAPCRRRRRERGRAPASRARRRARSRPRGRARRCPRSARCRRARRPRR